MDLTVINALVGFLVVMGTAFLIFFRIKIGKTGKKGEDDSASSSYRRNSIVISGIFIFYVYFLGNKYFFGKGNTPEMSGWKTVGIGAVLLMGIVSVILILYGTFRSKK